MEAYRKLAGDCKEGNEELALSDITLHSNVSVILAC
jgi:hypothetical protein